MISILFAAALASAGPAALPADIDPVSRSRLPPVDRSTLDADGQRVYDLITNGSASGPRTLMGPGPATLYAPKIADPYQVLNTRLRLASVGRRYFEISALVGAYDYRQDFEWSGHEPAAVAAGVEPAVLDVIRNNKPTDGLAEKDRAAIDFGRALLRGDRKVSSALWARVVGQFGRQGAVELAAIVGDYAMAAIMLNAVDQHPQPGREVGVPKW